MMPDYRSALRLTVSPAQQIRIPLRLSPAQTPTPATETNIGGTVAQSQRKVVLPRLNNYPKVSLREMGSSNGSPIECTV